MVEKNFGLVRISKKYVFWDTLTILMRVMTVFLFVLIQKRVMAPFTDNVLGLMRVTYGTRDTLLSFGPREYISECTIQ